MASSDEILDAMRQAGSEFARMADSIESRLPAIGEALSKAPAYLKPLKNDLDEVVKKAAELNIDEFVGQLSDANVQAGSLVQSMKSVQDAIDSVSAKAVGVAGDFRDIVTEAKASSTEVDRLTGKMDKFGDSLSERVENAKSLQDEIKNASGKFTPQQKTSGGLGRRGVEAAVGDDQSKALTELILKQVQLRASAEETGRAIKDLGDLTSPLRDVELNFQQIEMSVKALSTPLKAASKDMSDMTAEDIAAWGDHAAASVGQLAKHAEAMPGISPFDPKALRDLEEGLKAMKASGASLGDMQDLATGFRKQIEKAKNVGQVFDANLARDIKEAADETRGILSLSKKEIRAVVAWQQRHAKAADEASEHMNSAWANAVQLGKAVKDCPVPELASEIGALGKGINGLVGNMTKLGDIDLTNLKSLNMVGLAKAFIEVGDEVKKDRKALRELTAEAGMLSSMFQSGMGADQITGEYEKLRQSMNNMLNSWGKTEEESTGAMRSLVDAGFSMTSILGPTLKETESGLFAFARSGEHAMSGLEEIAKISAMTGKSMGAVAGMAGQWRETLGVTIGEVGETYLELESSARRSGLSVGRFMDRVMSSASGFVMFGGRVDDVANSLSNMMSGMTIPPGLAADVAADFMQRLSSITMTEAMTGIGMVSKAGTDELLKAAQSFHDVRAKEGTKLKKQIEALESGGLEAQDPEAYASKMAELQGKMRKVQEETGTYAKLLQDVAEGDKTAMAALYQEEAQRGHSSARRMKVLQDAATMGIKAEALQKEGVAIERALLDELVEMERVGTDRFLLEQQANAAGYKSFKEMKEIVRGQARLADAKVAWGKKLGVAGEEEEELFAIMAETGDVEGLANMMKDKGQGPASLLRMMQEMQAEGLAISDAALEEAQKAKAEYNEAVSDFGEESEQAREAAEAMRKTASETIAGVAADKKMPEEVVAEHAKKQTPLMEKIEQATRSIRKFMGTEMIAVLLAIKLALDFRALTSMVPGGKALGAGGKILSKVAKVFTKSGRAQMKSAKLLRQAAKARIAARGAEVGSPAVKAAAKAKDAWKAQKAVAGSAQKLAAKTDAAAKTMKAAQVNLKAAKGATGVAKAQAALTVATKSHSAALAQSSTKLGRFGAAALGAGKSILRVAGKFAGPLAVAVEGVFAAMEIRGKKQAAYQDAYNRALEKGKSEVEAKEIADRASVRAITKGDAGKAAGQVGGAATGIVTGAIAGAALGSFIPIIGTAVGGVIGGIVGSIGGSMLGKAAGQKIGDALETEADRFNRAVAEVVDLGTLDDAKSLVEQETAARDALQAEKMELIRKDAAGEKLTSDERKRLRDLQQLGIQKEKDLLIAKQVEEMKANEEYAEKYREGMSKTAKMRYEAGMKVRELRKKKRKQGGKLSAEDDQAMLSATNIAKASDETLSNIIKSREARGEKAVKRNEIRSLEKEKASIKKYSAGAGGELTASEAEEVASIDKKLAELNAGFSGKAPSPIGPPATGDDMLSTAAKMQGDRDKEKKAVGGASSQTTDNSTWNVHINSKSEKELQDAMLKTLVKHQQRLAN